MVHTKIKDANISDIVERLQSQSLQKRDFVVPAHYLALKNADLTMVGTESAELNALLTQSGVAQVDGDNQLSRFSVTETAHRQIAEKCGIPWNYYTAMRTEQAVGLLDTNVNYWFFNSNKNYLLRTFINPETNTGYARALLSDRFRAIDNWDVLIATLSAINNSGKDVEFKGGDLTDDKMFLRFTSPSVEVQAPELLKHYRVPGKPENWGNSGIMTGFSVSNSETGCGAFTIAPRIVIQACSNGMVLHTDAIRKTHIGAKLEKFSYIDWSARTKELNKELILAQVGDTIGAYLSTEWLGKVVGELQESAGIQITKPTATIQAVSRECSFTAQEADRILNAFIVSGDSTLFGIAQAITFYAQDKEVAPERQYELESLATGLCLDPAKRNLITLTDLGSK